MRDDSRTERWRRVEELYHAGLALTANERPAFLADACRGDAQLRGEVDALLSIAPDAADFLEPRVSAVIAPAAVDIPVIANRISTVSHRARLP